LKIRSYPEELSFHRYSNLERREWMRRRRSSRSEPLPAPTFPTNTNPGYRVLEGPKILTFAQVLKYNVFPLPSLVSDFLDLGRRAMAARGD